MTVHCRTGNVSVGDVTVAILGVPNVGKSALFNSIVGGHVEVANWPGTTTEVSSGTVTINGLRVTFFDLPGVYGLTGLGELERGVKKFLLEARPDVALVLVESLSPERSMSLAIQIMELHSNVVLALTKLDLAHSRGIHIDVEGLSRALGVPVIPTSVALGLGVRDVLEAIVNAYRREGRTLRVDYDVLEPYIGDLERELSKLQLDYPNARWLAVKLLEGDSFVEELVVSRGGSYIVERARAMREEVLKSFGREPAAMIAEYRARYALRIVKPHIVRLATVEARRGGLTLLDRIFLDYKTSIIASLGILIAAFLAVFSVNTGFPLNTILELAGFEEGAQLVESLSLSGLMDLALGSLSEAAEGALSGAPSWLRSFIVEGVVGGVGAVLLFAPLVFMASLLVALLEDSGLLPRIAVGSHRLLCKARFSGHAILPMTLCLGCNVAGLVSARAIPSYWERLRFYLLAALIPCQARLVVLIALASALGGPMGALALISTYAISMAALATLSHVLDRVSKSRFEPTLILEIPAIHKPLGKVLWWISWSRVRHYMVKAGTIIFLGSLAMWLLTHVTASMTYTENPEESLAGSIARLAQPILEPIGVDSWELTLALIAGFIAKELFLSTVVVVTGNPDPVDAIRELGSKPETLIPLMVFIALYTPCLATVATIRSESRSSRIALASILIAILAAYTISLAVHLLLAY